MSFINKFKDFMGIGEEDFEDDFEENGQQPEEIDDDPFGSFAVQPEYRGGKTEPAENTTAPRRDNKVVNINTTTQLQVVLVKPEKFEDASGIADHLLAKRTVVLNLESTNREIARRLVDFLSGVAYANGGQIKKVANSTYIITPYNVGVMGDSLLDELENSGLYL